MENKEKISAKTGLLNVNLKEFTGGLASKYAIVLILIGMILILSLLSPVFLKIQNLLNIVRQITVIGLLGMGATMAIITCGIDLSVGSIIALSAVTAASFAQNAGWAAAKYPALTGLPVFVPILIGLAAGTLIGLINGLLIAKTKIPPFIATLGMMTITRGAALLYSNGRPISSLTDSYCFIGQGVVLGIPFPILILILMAVITSLMLNNTKFGRYVYAIGGNAQAAKVSGINVSKILILVYTYIGFLAGLAGVILSSRISSGQPGLGDGYELFGIASSVIGGTAFSGGMGTIPGTMVGALIIGTLNNGLDLLNVSAYWQRICYGAIIIIAIIIDERKNKPA